MGRRHSHARINSSTAMRSLVATRTTLHRAFLWRAANFINAAPCAQYSGVRPDTIPDSVRYGQVPSASASTKVSHTDKWLDSRNRKSSPQVLMSEEPPIAVTQRVIKCVGGKDPALGHPAEFINVDDTSPQNAVACKYCASRYYLDNHH